MDRASWNRIETIVLGALERPPPERDAYLAQACGSDRALLQEVVTLIEAAEAESDFLDTPIGDISSLADAPPDGQSLATQRVGTYRLVRPLGRGGMGEVFLAVQEAQDFHQSVALKVIKRGMDTDEVLERFRLERQILASLNHANVAQLLDGGATDDGRPYFVMEYIEGLPIDEFCDRQRRSIQQRLELFQIICGAVQHAHRNLIVHRDLKPSNILVTDDGVPKLLDFGIGKVLAPSPSIEVSLHTRTDVRILTPEYASPEQIRGAPVTTATDVYGLGILLYELLTGHHPYPVGSMSLTDIERAVCETDPERPSLVVVQSETRRDRDGSSRTITPQEVSDRRATDPHRLRRRLSGDLDNIILKALRKEPERRYASATAFADDLQRHLDGLPVKARVDTLGYRAGKFVRRHTMGLSVAAAIFLALAATSVVTVVQSQRVTREAERVAQERDKALEVRGFLMEMFGAVGADEATADTVTARQLLDLQAARVAEAYQGQPGLQAEMLEVLADGYERLGLYEDAEPLAWRSLEIRRETSGAADPDLPTSLNMLGWILHQRGKLKEAEPFLREAVAIRRRAGSNYLLELSRSLNDLGVVRDNAGDHDEAAALYREALDIRLRLLGEDHRSVGITASNLSIIHYRKGAYDEAIALAEQALRVLRRAVGADHQRSLIVQSNLATMRSATGDFASAEEEYRDILERRTRVHGRQHPLTAASITSLATVLRQQGRAADAEALLREALAIQEATLGRSHPDVATALDRLGAVLQAQRKFAEAVALLERALVIRRATYDEPHFRIAETLSSMGRLRWRMGERGEGHRLVREALQMFELAAGPEHEQTNIRRTFACDQLLLLGRLTEALQLCPRAHAVSRALFPPGHREVLHTRQLNVRLQMAMGNYDRADSLLAESRLAIDAGEASNRQRALLDSLTAALAAMRKRP